MGGGAGPAGRNVLTILEKRPSALHKKTALRAAGRKNVDVFGEFLARERGLKSGLADLASGRKIGIGFHAVLADVETLDFFGLTDADSTVEETNNGPQKPGGEY